MKNIDIKLTEEEVNLLDSVLTNDIIRVEFPNGKRSSIYEDLSEKEKDYYRVLSDLLRKIENASTFF